MNAIGKYSRAGLVTGAMVALSAFALLFAVSQATKGVADPLPQASATPASSVTTPVAESPKRLPGGSTQSDIDARLELASDYKSNSDVPFEDALASAYDTAAWQVLPGYDRRTGEAQHGWFAKELFTSLDVYANPGEYADGRGHIHQILIVNRGGTMNAQFTVPEGDVQYDSDAMGSPYVRINIAFDLPSGKHRYMKVIGLPGTHGSVILDGDCVPELLAQVMTSTYMHIFVPMVGQPSDEELMFFDSSFRDVMSPSDRAMAKDAMESADKK